MTREMRRIIWRVKPTPGSQLALFATCRYHAFITDREGDTSELKADYRRHADVKKAIRDLNYSVGLNHLPAGRFPANAVRLAVQSLPRTLYGVNAHNVARWAARIGWGSRWQPPRPSDDASSLWPDASPCISPKIGPGKTSSAPTGRDCALYRSLPVRAATSDPSAELPRRVAPRLGPGVFRRRFALMIAPNAAATGRKPGSGSLRLNIFPSSPAVLACQRSRLCKSPLRQAPFRSHVR